MDEENKGEGLSPLEERWEEISGEIDNYLQKIGAKCKKPTKVEEILNLPYEDLRTLSAEECGENSFILSQYAYFLQQEYNYHKSKVDWCEVTITYAVANYGDPSTYVKPPEKAARLSFNNQAIKKVMKMQATARVMMNSLEFLSSKITSMVETLRYLQQSKRKL